MRPALGFAAAQLLLIVPGYLLLWCTGLARATIRSAVLALGPAFLLGLALVAVLLQLLLVLGVTLSLGVTLLVILALCVALWVVGRRRGIDAPLPPATPYRSTAERALVWLGGAMTALWFLLGSRSFDQLPTQVDNARIWSLRSLGLFYDGDLRHDMFTDPAYSTSHLDYPLLVPLLNSTIFRSMGGEDLRLVHLELWIAMAAFAWTVAWALAPGRRPLSWLPMVAVLPILGPIVDNVALGNVDTLLAGFVVGGALLIALWIEDGHPGRAVAGGVLLAGAAATKNEGLVAAILVLAVAGLALVARRPPDALRWWLTAVGIVAVAIVPWQAWIAAHGISNRDVPGLGESLDPAFLSERTARLGTALERLFIVFANQGVYLWIMPAFLALAVAALVMRRSAIRQVAVLYLACIVLYVCALLWVYWTARLDLTFHLDTTVGRLSITYMLLALVGLAHLASSVVRDRDRDRGGAAETAATPAATPDRPPAALAAGDPAPTSEASRPPAT